MFEYLNIWSNTATIVQQSYHQLLWSYVVFYYNYYTQYVINAISTIIKDDVVISYVPILIPLIMIISIGNIWHVCKNMMFLILKLLLAFIIMIICIRLFS